MEDSLRKALVAIDKGSPQTWEEMIKLSPDFLTELLITDKGLIPDNVFDMICETDPALALEYCAEKYSDEDFNNIIDEYSYFAMRFCAWRLSPEQVARIARSDESLALEYCSSKMNEDLIFEFGKRHPLEAIRFAREQLSDENFMIIFKKLDDSSRHFLFEWHWDVSPRVKEIKRENRWKWRTL